MLYILPRISVFSPSSFPPLSSSSFFSSSLLRYDDIIIKYKTKTIIAIKSTINNFLGLVQKNPCVSCLGVSSSISFIGSEFSFSSIFNNNNNNKFIFMK